VGRVADWTNVVGAVGGTVGTLTAVATAVWNVRGSRRERRERADSALSAQEEQAAATAIAREAAASARRSADEAARVAAIQVAARHEALAPTQRTVPTHVTRSAVGTNLFGEIRVDRDYRVRAQAVRDNANWSISVPDLLRAHEPYRFHIELWPRGRTKAEAQAVVLKFWPPIDADEVEQWTCDCGKPLTGGSERDPGHWEIRLPLERPDGAIVVR
jgi:hypothetical protein